MPHEPHRHMTRAELRALRLERGHPETSPDVPDAPANRCPYCTALLSNGRAVCSDECDTGWWNVVPTLDGSLYRG